MVRSLILFQFLFSIATSYVHASPELDTINAQTEILLRAQSILLEMSLKVEDEIKKDGSVTDNRLEHHLKQSTSQILEEYEVVTHKPGLAKRMWNALTGFKWSNLVNTVKKTGQSMNRLGKVHGIAAATGIVLGTSLEFIVPAVFVKIGLPQLVPLSAITPYQPILYGIVKKQENYKRDQRLASMMGGWDVLKESKKAHAALREEFQLNKATDLLFPITLGSNSKFAVVSKESHAAKLLAHFGIKSKKLSLTALNHFYKNHLPDSELPKALAETHHLTDQVKTMLLVESLYSNNPSNTTIQEFESRFKDSLFTKSDRQMEESSKTLDWLKELPTVKNKNQIAEFVSKMPTEVRSITMANLWSTVVVPYLLYNLHDLSFKESVRLKHELLPVLASSQLFPEVKVDERVKDKYSNYIVNTIKTKPAVCRRAFLQVVELPPR